MDRRRPRRHTVPRDTTLPARALGIQVLPHANRSERQHYGAYYDDDTQKLVASRNLRLIDRFGYEFVSI